jgi:hypothetical protein
MDLIKKANCAVATDVLESVMIDLSKEGIDAEEAFISPQEFANILDEVDARVAKGKERPAEISDWVKARLRVLINRPNISSEQQAIFDELDAATDHQDYASIFEDATGANNNTEYAIAA